MPEPTVLTSSESPRQSPSSADITAKAARGALSGPVPGWGVSLFMLAVFQALCFGVAYLGARVTTPHIDAWYRTLEKPPLTPPDWVFPVAWTVLFALMALAAWLVWRRPPQIGRPAPRKRLALGLFFVQLALNLGWSVVFFGYQQPFYAGLEILVLLVAIAVTLVLFWRISASAGLLFLPYLLWVGFATYLTWGIAVHHLPPYLNGPLF